MSLNISINTHGNYCPLPTISHILTLLVYDMQMGCISARQTAF